MNKTIKKYTLLKLGVFLAYKGFKLLMRPKAERNLKGKVVVITGASMGIGKEYAYEFAKKGCKLVLSARSEDKLNEIANDLHEKFQIDVISVPTDVSKKEDCYNLVEQALDKFGHIDIFINNAGIVSYEFFTDHNPENFKKVMDVNYWGTVYCTQAVIPSMMSRKSGKIINISSFIGKRAVPIMSTYSASKFAMEGFTESLRVEMKQYGIDVIIIRPTVTKTNLTENSVSDTKLNVSSNFGMSPKRVAKETINTILDNKREHTIGRGEQLTLMINIFFPQVIDFFMRFTTKFMVK